MTTFLRQVEEIHKRGCDICFATFQKEALEFLQHFQFDLVLSEFMLSDGAAHQLIAPLCGTETTMFFSNVIEDGRWWTTAVFEGRDRSEEPGISPAEFGIRLHELLHDKLFENSNNPWGSLTDRRNDVPSGFGNQTAVSARSHGGEVGVQSFTWYKRPCGNVNASKCILAIVGMCKQSEGREQPRPSKLPRTEGELLRNYHSRICKGEVTCEVTILAPSGGI